MINKNLLAAFVLFYYPLYVQSFALNEYFDTYDEVQGVRVAFRAYFLDDVVVTLIPTYHHASKSFYDLIAKKIRGKKVIYENMGASFEQQQAFVQNINKLDTDTVAKWERMERIKTTPDENGFVSQAYLDYSAASHLVHGDIVLKPHIQNWSDKKIKSFISRQDEFLFVSRDRRQEVTNNHYLVDSLRNINSPIASQIDRALDFLQIRSEKAVDALQKLLKIKTEFDEICIVYGAVHMPYIENELTMLGFIPLEEGEDWFSVDISS